MTVLAQSPAREPRGADQAALHSCASPAPSSCGSVHRVKVALRTRPLLPQEKIQKARECVRPDSTKDLVTFGRDRLFAFDRVYDQGSRQEDVFRECTGELVDAVFEGYNACVFAYGQTSSGKTFTMGSGSHLVSEDDVGLIPRVINEIFERCETVRREEPLEAGGGEEATQTTFRIRCQFLEIHNEEVKDLLDPSSAPTTSSRSAASKNGSQGPSGGIAIRENGSGQIVVAGAKEEEVGTREDLMRLLEMGSASRTTGDTRMNAHSSRSHAIFTIFLDQDRGGPQRDAGEGRLSAKFHLVDLAGSERQKKTGATGKRFKESVTINRGLLALGNVISALSKKQAHKHVPYRESKLTRMLQDSIGGNSRTIMIACVSTSDTNMEETLNTLKYASRARNIKNVAYVNYRKDPRESEIPDLPEAEAGAAAGPVAAEEDAERLVELEERLRDAEGRNNALQRLLDDKIAVESSLQQLVQQFTSTGDISEEATRHLKDALLASPRKALRPPRQRPLSAVVTSRAPGSAPTAARPKSAVAAAAAKADGLVVAGDGDSEVDDFAAENEDEVLFDEGIGEELFSDENEGQEDAPAASSVGGVDLDLSRRRLEEELKQLSGNISRKEELIRTLERNQEEARAASSAYEAIAQELEAQVREKEGEVERLKREVSDLDESIVQSVEEKHELKLEYDEKLRVVAEQLGRLKRKLGEGDSTRLERVRAQSEEKISALESDLNEMKVKQGSLKRKLSEAKDAYEAEVGRKDRELELARREADDRDRRIEQLEKQNKRQTTLLRKKAEEAATAKRKLKELNQNSSSDVERLAQGAKAWGSPAGKGKAARALTAVGKAAPKQERAVSKAGSRTKVALDQQVEMLVQKNEIREQLEGQKRRKIELMAEREGILGEIAPFQQKKKKQEEIIKLKIREFAFAIEELDAEIDRMQGEAEAGNEVARKEVVELQNFRSDAYARRCDLQQMLSTGKVLSDKEGEDLSDLEDRLDGIVTEVDYVTQQINESKTQLERAEASAAKMRRLVGSLSQRETQQVLALYLNAVVEMQGKERRDAHRITELEVDLAERAARIDQLASGIKARDLEYDVRTTRLEEEHASKMQDVFSHLNLALVAEKGGGVRMERSGSEDGNPGADVSSSREILGLVNLQQEQMEVLDRQNHQLRDTNEDLTKRVRQAQEQAEQSQTTYEAKISRMSLNLEDANNLNKSLMDEVSNYKKHLRSLGSAVRISRSSLRPLSAAQVHQKQIRASISGKPGEEEESG